MVNSKSLKYLKSKQKAYFKEHNAYATDDIQISTWMEEYHDDCVMEKALNDTVLGNAGEEVMLRKLWLKVINQRLGVDGVMNSFDVTNFADGIIASYRGTFVDYIPPVPYEPPPMVVNNPVPIDRNERNFTEGGVREWGFDDEDTL